MNVMLRPEDYIMGWLGRPERYSTRLSMPCNNSLEGAVV